MLVEDSSIRDGWAEAELKAGVDIKRLSLRPLFYQGPPLEGITYFRMDCHSSEFMHSVNTLTDTARGVSLNPVRLTIKTSCHSMQ